MSEVTELPAPKCLALVLCEQVIQDRETRNLTLVNIFNTISASPVGKGVPRHDRLAVFVSLTNGRGQSQGKLVIKDADEREVFHGEGPVVFPDPVTVVEMTFDIRRLPLPCEGEYTIEFWCGAEMVNQRKFRVKRAQGGK